MEKDAGASSKTLESMPVIVTAGLVTGALTVSGATLALTSFGAWRAATGGYIEPATIWSLIGGLAALFTGIGLCLWLALHLRAKSSLPSSMETSN